jgi:hypothetical protein
VSDSTRRHEHSFSTFTNTLPPRLAVTVRAYQAQNYLALPLDALPECRLTSFNDGPATPLASAGLAFKGFEDRKTAVRVGNYAPKHRATAGMK